MSSQPGILLYVYQWRCLVSFQRIAKRLQPHLYSRWAPELQEEPWVLWSTPLFDIVTLCLGSKLHADFIVLFHILSVAFNF